MIERPAEGAWLDRPAFEGQAPRPGWNKLVYEDGREPSYIFYDLAAIHADRKPFLPHGVDEATVNVVRPAVADDARHSQLWLRASQLASKLPQRLMPLGLSKSKLTMKAIASYTALQRKTEALMPLMNPILKSLIDGVDFGSATGSDPALRVAERYMRFKVPGIMARYLLSSIYKGVYATVPGLFNRRSAPARTMVMRKAEDLSDAAYRLFKARSAYNVAGFSNATYLATLCAATVITMGSDESMGNLQFSPEERSRLRRLRQNADELSAHYLLGAFSLPARFRAKEILTWVRTMATALGKAPVQVAEEECLHPGLIAVLTDPDEQRLDEAGVQERYAHNVADRPGLSIDDSLHCEAAALRINLHSFLLD